MIYEFFYETLKISLPVSLLIFLILKLTPQLNKIFGAGWRMKVWLVIGVNLCVPLPYLWSFCGRLFLTADNAGDFPDISAFSSSSSYSHISFESLIDKAEPALIGRLSAVMPEYIFYIWLSGIVIYSILLLNRYIRFRKDIILWGSPASSEDNFFNDVKHIPVYIYPKCSTAMIVGYIKPLILLPEISYSDLELNTIIEHEYQHFLRKDLWKKLFFQTVLVLHWYNPLIHIMVGEVNLDIEIGCDADLIEKHGTGFKNVYSGVILQTLRYSSNRRKEFSADWMSQADAVKMRLENIYEIHKMNGKPLIIISIVFVLFVGALIIGANKNSPHYLMPEYHALVQKAVMENYEREEENNYAVDKKKDYVILTEDMYENEYGINFKDSFDEEQMRKKQAQLQGAALWNSPWEDTIYYYNSYKGYIEPHVLNSGQITVYSKDNNTQWKLNEGDTLSFEITVNNNCYGSSGIMTLGYIIDEKIPDMSENRPEGIIKELKINDYEKTEFTAPSDGSYIFYILCGDSAPVLINLMKIS